MAGGFVDLNRQPAPAGGPALENVRPEGWFDVNSPALPVREPAPPDMVVTAALAIVTIVSFTATLAAFLASPMHAGFASWANGALKSFGLSGGIYLLYGIILLIAIALGWRSRHVLRNVLFLSWVLYLPTVMYFSGLDPMGILVQGGFTALAAPLPPALVLLMGLLLVSATTAQSSASELGTVRTSLTGRGADSKEVDAAVRRCLACVGGSLAAAAALAAVTALAGTLLLGLGAGLPSWGGYEHIVLAIAGAAVVAFILIVLLRRGDAG